MATRARGPVHLLAAAAAALALALAGCSAADGGEAATDEGAAGGGVVAPAAEDGSGESARQVVQTGSLAMSVDDPRAGVDAIVTLVEGTGGRVDSRSEHAATDEDSAWAALTVRVPADDVSATIDALREIGSIDDIQLDAQDVTGVAQDLDARIRALEISVSRMEDLLARVTTTKDLVAAEAALSERQASLEQLRAERARLAEQVALATLEIQVSGPGAVPAARSGPTSFLDGLAVGWQSLGVAVEKTAVVVAVLLPWLLFFAAIAAVVVLVRRAYKHRRTPVAAHAEGTDA